MPKKEKAFSLEEALENLEELVTDLEEGNLSLEESLLTFERGIGLTKTCQQHLSNAEQKVTLLLGDQDDLTLGGFDETIDD